MGSFLKLKLRIKHWMNQKARKSRESVELFAQNMKLFALNILYYNKLN